MKAHLMHRDADFDRRRPAPAQASAAIADLGLDSVLDAMAGGDTFLREVARSALLAPLADPAAIAWRQDVLADCLAHEDTVRQLYDLAVRTLQEKKESFWAFFHGSPSSVLSTGTGFLELFQDKLRRLRAIADTSGDRFGSAGFTTFFAAIATELGDDYLDEVARHVHALRLRHGLTFSARLGRGNKTGGYVVRAPRSRPGLRGRLRHPGGEPSFTVVVPDRDEGGAQELEELRDRALNPVANAVAQAADHLTSFFVQLRTELGFYLGGVNLYRALTAAGMEVCFPQPAEPGEGLLTATGLYDPALPLRGTGPVVGNDLHADRRPLVVITGANQGGKSSFLRAIAVAGYLAAAGLPAPARTFRFSPVSAVFTHYRRPEDTTMVHGKFDEELVRMRQIIEQASPHALVAMNESFASTNDAEAADVAVPVIRALLDTGIRVVLVTHSYELAARLLRDEGQRAVSLRAQRLADGARTFTLAAAPPLTTSFAADLYRQIFST